jgi:hypothetical protein
MFFDLGALSESDINSDTSTSDLRILSLTILRFSATNPGLASISDFKELSAIPKDLDHDSYLNSVGL